MEINPKKSVEELVNTLPDAFVIQFWGVRGTLPVPGKKTIHYGGNTNCVSLRCGPNRFLIFDAGTGIKELSNYLVQNHLLPISAKIFLTHPHYDHINGIPFFVPLYLKGNQFEFLGMGHGSLNIKNLISNQMDSVYFPVTINEFESSFSFRNLTDEILDVDGLKVSTIPLNHPGGCLGYRVNYQNKSFCFITDNELYLEDSPHYDAAEVARLVNFIKETDLLIIDSTYSDEVYKKKVNWGHSAVSRVVDVAIQANVKVFCLFHHDPDQYDEDIAAKVKSAQALLKQRHSKIKCIAPREGDVFVLE